MLSKSAFCFKHKFTVCYTNRKWLNTTLQRDKLIVNYLKFPKLFGPTGEEILKDVDLQNKKCFITGGTSGIGLEMVRCLTAKNCDIIMACRNPYVAQTMSKNVWGGLEQLTTYMTNLSSFASVKNACDQILKKEQNIDIVILNAAVFGLPWILTEDNLETIFQVNFLSQFYLLMRLESILAPDARVVFMSSESHRNLKWSIEKMILPTADVLSLPQEEYTSIKAYNTSKLCGIFAMHYLFHRWSKTARSVFCAHPGSFVKTNICSNWWPYEILYTMMYPFSKSIAQAAATPLYCATSPDLQGRSDIYFKNCKECEMSDLAYENQLAYRVIELSKNMLMDIDPLKEDFAEEVETTEFDSKPEEINPEASKIRIEEPVLST